MKLKILKWIVQFQIYSLYTYYFLLIKISLFFRTHSFTASLFDFIFNFLYLAFELFFFSLIKVEFFVIILKISWLYRNFKPFANTLIINLQKKKERIKPPDSLADDRITSLISRGNTLFRFGSKIPISVGHCLSLKYLSSSSSSLGVRR